MSKPIDVLGVYLHLAWASQQRQRLHVRDRLLVIAAVNATRIGLNRIAAYCRLQVLEHNPQHLIRRWPTITEALEQSDFLHFLKQLQRRYPLERAPMHEGLFFRPTSTNFMLRQASESSSRESTA